MNLKTITVSRIIKKRKSKNYTIKEYYSDGKIMGYLENDEHFRNRIKKMLNEKVEILSLQDELNNVNA